jgi:hypothetical protein
MKVNDKSADDVTLRVRGLHLMATSRSELSSGPLACVRGNPLKQVELARRTESRRLRRLTCDAQGASLSRPPAADLPVTPHCRPNPPIVAHLAHRPAYSLAHPENYWIANGTCLKILRPLNDGAQLVSDGIHFQILVNFIQISIIKWLLAT